MYFVYVLINTWAMIKPLYNMGLSIYVIYFLAILSGIVVLCSYFSPKKNRNLVGFGRKDINYTNKRKIVNLNDLTYIVEFED